MSDRPEPPRRLERRVRAATNFEACDKALHLVDGEYGYYAWYVDAERVAYREWLVTLTRMDGSERL